MQTVSEPTNEAARAFIIALRSDFEGRPDANIVAHWTKDGYLLVCARGYKAAAIDAYLRDAEYAIPGGRDAA